MKIPKELTVRAKHVSVKTVEWERVIAAIKQEAISADKKLSRHIFDILKAYLERKS